MRIDRRFAAAAVALIVVGFVGVLIGALVIPPNAGTFNDYVVREAVKIALQLLGVTAVGALIADLVRQTTERIDYARRVRTVYSKAKACRRRLRRVTGEEQRKELEKLETVQLEFEDLQEEAERRFGKKSPAAKGLSSIQGYLNNVVEAGLPQTQMKAGVLPGVLADFVQEYKSDSRFAREFRRPYDTVRKKI